MRQDMFLCLCPKLCETLSFVPLMLYFSYFLISRIFVLAGELPRGIATGARDVFGSRLMVQWLYEQADFVRRYQPRDELSLSLLFRMFSCV